MSRKPTPLRSAELLFDQNSDLALRVRGNEELWIFISWNAELLGFVDPGYVAGNFWVSVEPGILEPQDEIRWDLDPTGQPRSRGRVISVTPASPAGGFDRVEIRDHGVVNASN